MAEAARPTSLPVAEESNTGSSSSTTTPLEDVTFTLWFVRGIFKYFMFPSSLKTATPNAFKKMAGVCNICKDTVKGVYRCTTNYIRHFKVKQIIPLLLSSD